MSLRPIEEGLHASWRKPKENGSTITEYELVLEDRSGAVLKSVFASWTVNSGASINDLEGGVSYQVKARARNAIGWGPFGDPVVGVPDFPPSNWGEIWTEDAMNGRRSLSLVLLSNDFLSGRYGDDLYLGLVVQCHLETSANVQFNLLDSDSGGESDFAHNSAGDEHVRFRFDDGDLIEILEDGAYDGRIRVDGKVNYRKYWDISVWEELTFEGLTAMILSSQTLTVEVTPYGSSAQVVTFDLYGFERVLPELLELCE